MGQRNLGNEVVIRPTVAKTFVKGLIAIGVFSLFLEVNLSNLRNYLIFVAISLVLVLFYMGAKWSSRYVIGPTSLSILQFLRAEKIIPYTEIEAISVSQGILAKRFHCVSLYIQLSERKKGSYISLSGQMAETLRDIKNPEEVYEKIQAGKNPFFIP